MIDLQATARNLAHSLGIPVFHVRTPSGDLIVQRPSDEQEVVARFDPPPAAHPASHGRFQAAAAARP